MAESFTKLWSTITDSTIWCEDSDTRVVWITMLAMSDQHGRVLASVPGLAKRAAVSLEATEKALAKFLNPDRYSRSNQYDPDSEGRRIEVISEGGWRLINYAHHRARRDEEERKIYMRDYMQKRRSVNKPVSNVSQSKPPLSQAEAEAEAEAEADKNKNKGASAFVLPEWVPLKQWNDFIEQRKRLRKNPTDHAKELLIKKLEELGGDSAAILEQSTVNGWQSVFPLRESRNGNGQVAEPHHTSVNREALRQAREIDARRAAKRADSGD